MRKALIAGATGYLGQFVAKEFKRQDYFTRIIARNIEKFKRENIPADELINAEFTKPETLTDCCRNIDVVFTSVGITKQKDGLTYMDVDYQANLNLLEEAKRSGVKKFIYVSVFNGDRMTDLKICGAKERFVESLKHSGIGYCIIRPTGYFSDMGDFLKMARKGRAYLLKRGAHSMNPISGEDLAEFCVASVDQPAKELPIGGPEVFTYNQIAALAFTACKKESKIFYIPDGVIKFMLWLTRTFTNSKTYGPIEFFITVLSMDMVAPNFGKYKLETYFEKLKDGM